MKSHTCTHTHTHTRAHTHTHTHTRTRTCTHTHAITRSLQEEDLKVQLADLEKLLLHTLANSKGGCAHAGHDVEQHLSSVQNEQKQ